VPDLPVTYQWRIHFHVAFQAAMLQSFCALNGPCSGTDLNRNALVRPSLNCYCKSLHVLRALAPRSHWRGRGHLEMPSPCGINAIELQETMGHDDLDRGRLSISDNI
jgi:hypothetical protein